MNRLGFGESLFTNSLLRWLTEKSMIKLSTSDRTRIVEIFNNAMSTTPYIQRISIDDIPEEPMFGHKGLLDLKNYFNQIDPDRMEDPFYQVFSQFSIDKKGQEFSCYHFKRLDRAVQLIESGSIALNTLFSNRDNDYAEFEEFFRRYGPLENLIPSTYERPEAGDIRPLIPRDRKVDALKNQIFVTCFTKSYDNPRFWHEYARDKGLCFRFRFYGFRNETVQNFGALKRTVQHLYQLREVGYDTDGYLYDFLNEINYRLGQEFGLVLFNRGIPIAAQFYKRSRYSWEQEIRLAIDLPFVQMRYMFPLEKHLNIIKSGDRQTILIPIAEPNKSPFFGLELQDVFCSKDLEEIDLVKKTASANFPNAKIWEYEEWSRALPYK
jgi:hypothetical protein